MFGISFIEFIIILAVVVIMVGPKDIPDLARNIVRFVYKFKQFIAESKKELKSVGDEMGLGEIRQEIEQELIAEKIKLEKEVTTIVDIYGEEHHVYGVDELRSDLKKEDLKAEIVKHNQVNNEQINKNLNSDDT